MNAIQFLRLIRMIYGNRVDTDKIQKMGLLAVKIGQVHALRPDFLKPETCTKLAKLYRATIPIPTEDVLKKIDMKKFLEVEKKPLASASVGQVHRARLPDEKEVVIKVVKAGFKKQFKKDVKSVKRIMNTAIFFYPKLKKVFDPVGILEHIEEYTLRELDLRNEVEGQKILKKAYEENKDKYDLSDMKLPGIYEELCGQDIMVSEFLDAKTFDELLNEGKLDYKELLKLFKLHGFFLFRIGTFHDDIHPGNIMLCKDKICFVDTGAIGHSSKRLRQGLLKFFDRLSVYDYEGCAEYLESMSQKNVRDKTKFVKEFKEVYKDFKGKNVTEVSLTKQMMKTIKLGVHNGLEFEKGMFSIIKSLMFLDGMVIRCKPDAILLEDMRKYMKELLE